MLKRMSLPQDSVSTKLVDLRCAKVKDEAWLAHVANALTQSASSDGDVITWAGYNSLLANDVSVKPPAVIGVYPLFPDKAASAEVLTSGRAQSTLHLMNITSSARGMPTGSHCIAVHAQAERIRGVLQ